MEDKPMKMKINLAVVSVLFMILIAGCSLLDTEIDPPEVRIKNGESYYTPREKFVNWQGNQEGVLIVDWKSEDPYKHIIKIDGASFDITTLNPNSTTEYKIINEGSSHSVNATQTGTAILKDGSTQIIDNGGTFSSHKLNDFMFENGKRYTINIYPMQEPLGDEKNIVISVD